MDFKIQLGKLLIEYDRAYGPAKRHGWCVVKDGSYYCEHKSFALVMRELWRIFLGNHTNAN